MGRSSRDEEGRSREPRAVGEVLRGIVGGPMRRGVQLGRLVRAWDRVAGEPLCRETAPVALTGQALVIRAATPAWAAQARFLAEELRRRANRALGVEEIRSVKIVVGPVGTPFRPGGEPAG